MEELINDIKKLCDSGCPWHPSWYEAVKTLTVFDGYSSDVNTEDYAFHPDGNSGCVYVPDDYIFGIRCDRLMWMTGEHEYHGTGVLLIGNHKGTLIIKFLHE